MYDDKIIPHHEGVARTSKAVMYPNEASIPYVEASVDRGEAVIRTSEAAIMHHEATAAYGVSVTSPAQPRIPGSAGTITAQQYTTMLIRPMTSIENRIAKRTYIADEKGNDENE